MGKKKAADPFSFAFGANKPKRPKTGKGGGKKGSGKGRGGSGRGNAWSAYLSGGVSNAPIPD